MSWFGPDGGVRGAEPGQGAQFAEDCSECVACYVGELCPVAERAGEDVPAVVVEGHLAFRAVGTSKFFG